MNTKESKMAGKNDAFMKRLLSTFKVEADEHIKNITAGSIWKKSRSRR